jgi:hypothetical protein
MRATRVARSAGSRLGFAGILALTGALGASSCFESGDRYYLEGFASLCNDGARRCSGTVLERCEDGDSGANWVTSEDCADQDQICSTELLACAVCEPGKGRCDGQTASLCDATGDSFTFVDECDVDAGEACRDGGCQKLCAVAATRRSNVGCEYWAVDLDNARVSDMLNAAAQQFAVVISNPQPDIAATVRIEQDDSEPGQENDPTQVIEAVVPAFSARVFRLGPREVDGSPPGKFNAGTHTALTRAAYRITSTMPIVAYQFNPLENVNVFSNDASLLKPVEALTPPGAGLRDAYVVLGWPQTIAKTDDPRTNFDPTNPSDLRAFLTLVGTREDTRVRIRSSVRVVPGGPVEETMPGEEIELTLQPFDVLNLETGGFNADFTGSLVQADGPIVAFVGSEASDAPFFPDLSHRDCCADHLEEQLDPIRTAGKSFIAAVSPNRAEAIVAAGSTIGEAPQFESFRVIAVTDRGARVTTTLANREGRFELAGKGSFVDVSSAEHFAIVSDEPVMLASISPSQEAANVPRGLPGGDPSLLIFPPIEQFRTRYVFLTPDKYSFDFVRIMAPAEATIVFDGVALEDLTGCVEQPAGSAATPSTATDLASKWVVYSCQLSFPEIDPDLAAPANLTPGEQNDGVHRIESSHKVGVLVDGFDSFVSYAYAAGTELETIVTE